MMDEQLKAYPDFMRVLTHPKIHKERKKEPLRLSSAVKSTIWF